jgi:hypothetical protein
VNCAPGRCWVRKAVIWGIKRAVEEKVVAGVTRRSCSLYWGAGSSVTRYIGQHICSLSHKLKIYLYEKIPIYTFGRVQSTYFRFI